MGFSCFCGTRASEIKVSPVNLSRKEPKVSFLDENFKGYHYSILFKVLNHINENQKEYKANGPEELKKKLQSYFKNNYIPNIELTIKKISFILFNTNESQYFSSTSAQEVDFSSYTGEIEGHCSKPPRTKETVWQIQPRPTEQPVVTASQNEPGKLFTLFKNECFKPLEAIIWILENRVKPEVISQDERNYIHNCVHQFDYEELELLYPFFTVFHYIPPKNITEMRTYINLILKKINQIW